MRSQHRSKRRQVDALRSRKSPATSAQGVVPQGMVPLVTAQLDAGFDSKRRQLVKMGRRVRVQATITDLAAFSQQVAKRVEVSHPEPSPRGRAFSHDRESP